MRVILYGASGMVGQGALRECQVEPEVDSVLLIGRSPSGVSHVKVRELVRPGLMDYSGLDQELSGYDACFFCLGVSSAGMKEADYERITYGLTLAAAEPLARLNPGMTFVYVSGAGTDSSESGRVMWARVKGRTENALLRLPFRAAFMFRPGVIQPKYGARSKTSAIRIFYTVTAPILPLARLIFPNSILTTEQIGRAMLNVVRRGYAKRVLETADIRAAAN